MTILRSLLEKLTGKVSGYLIALVFTAAFVSLDESQTLAWRFRAREPPEAHKGITLVALDEGFAESYDYPRVTPREVLAEIVRLVSEHGPAVIGLDYRLLRTDARERPAAYIELREAIAAAGGGDVDVVLAGQLRASKWSAEDEAYVWLPVPPPEDFGNVAKGFVNLWGKPVVTAPLLLPLEEDPEREVPAFALVLADYYRGRADGRGSGDWQALLDDLGVPASQRRGLVIDYFGPVREGRPARVAAEDLSQISHSELADRFFREKVVVVGSTYPEPSGVDTFETPFGAMRGVEVHVNILHTLLAGRYLVQPGTWATVGLTLLAVGLAWVAFWRLSLPWAIAATTGWIFVLYPLLGFHLFAAHRLILPMAWPMKGGFVAVLLLYTLQESNKLRFPVRSYEDLVLRIETGDDPEIVEVTALPGPGRPEPVTERTLARPRDPWGPCGTREQALARWRRGDVDPDFLKELGHRLFQTLLAGRLGEVYRGASRRARLRLGGVRLRLEIGSPALARLPWEVLYDRSARRFLTDRRDLVLARGVTGGGGVPPRLDEPALEVLVLLPDPASGSDAGWEETLYRELEGALREEHAPVRLTVLGDPSPEGLAALAGRQFHVVHVIGPVMPESWPSFEKLRLLVLDASRPPLSSGPEEVYEWAAAKVAAGVPAVLATAVTLTDRSTLLFFRVVYRRMAEGRPVDESVAAGRRALFDRDRPRPGRDFGAPVLLMSSSKPVNMGTAAVKSSEGSPP